MRCPNCNTKLWAEITLKDKDFNGRLIPVKEEICAIKEYQQIKTKIEISDDGVDIRTIIKEVKWMYITTAIQKANGSLLKAARLLGLPESTFTKWRKICKEST